MPLEPPILDSRTFEQLVELARSRIPRYTPEWTDFNTSDPGITLVELFAWLTEQMLFEMNRVPDRTYLKVLQLLGLELTPPQAAVAHLTFVPDPAAPAFAPVDAGTAIAGQPPDGGASVVFETTEGLDITRVPLAAVQVADGGSFTDVTEVNTTEESPFRPLGWVPQPGNALYLGFTPPAAGRAFPHEIRLRVYVPESAPPPRAESPRVAIAWEYTSAAEPTRWRGLSTFLDESRGFSREGYVRLEGPGRPVATIQGKVADPLIWIRARLAGGGYPAGAAPQIDFVRCNTVPARNLSTVRDEPVGTGNGRADQTFTLVSTPVDRTSVELSVALAGEDPETWTLVDDLYPSTSDDAHFTLVAATGEIRFGDGHTGRIPPGGARIVAHYRFGGGVQGNLPAGQINSPQIRLAGVAEVANPRAAAGGRDEQPVADLKAAAPSLLRHRGRAVSAGDFAALAADSGGVRRATALALAHPDHPGVEVPGAVTVIIVPEDGGTPPRPSPELIDRVRTRLEAVRLITTELFVTGPDYQAVGVEAFVGADPAVAGGTVQREVLAAIDRFLDPASRDFGADLIPTALYGVIQSVTAVRDVRSLSITVKGRPRDVTEHVVAGPGVLFHGADHRITVAPFLDR